MLANHSTSQQPNNISKTDFLVPGAVIAECLGSGLTYLEWQAVVEGRGYVWTTRLKNAIIEKEWEFFRPEIQRLRLEPEIAHSASSISNSLVSICKRLKGEPWLEGCPDEREERLRTHRLLGKDAKIRCLQKYVHDWDQEAALSKSRLLAKNASVKSAMGTVSGHSFICGSIGALPGVLSSGDSFEPEAIFSQGNVRTEADTLASMFDGPPQLGSSLPSVSTQTGTCSSTSPGFDSLRSPPIFNLDEGMSSFSHYPIGEDEVPNSADHSQSFHTPEPEHNVLNWMETNQVSEPFESLESAAFGPDTGFQGTFLDPRSSIDMNTFFILDDRETLEDGSATEGMPTDFSGQHNSPPGLLAGSSRSISSPRSSSKSRKRRRRSTPELNLNTPSYGHGATPTTSHMTADGDTVMSGSERSLQHTNKPVSERSWTQLPPPSKPLPIPRNSVMIPKATYEIRAQIELESELQRTRNELAFVKKQHETEIAFLRKQHQKEVESSIRIRKAAEAEIAELHEKVREIQKSTEHYEELARSAISDNIVLQESISRKKSVSGQPPTSTEEREHSTKQVQFPYPRPLSLTLRPATARKTSPSPPRRPSPSNLDNTSSLRLPITTSSSSRPVTPDNNQVFSGNPSPSNVSPKSTSQRCRPDSSDSNHVSSAQHFPISSPPKSAGRSNGSGLTDNMAAPNPSTSSRRGFPQFMRTLSHPFLRKQYRDDSTKEAPTVPSLPPLEASVPLNRQMAGVLIDGDKRLTNDSGYDSLRSGTSYVPSVADT